MTVERIVSGGQTGADRGAFDAALGFGIEIGGWAPKGRVDEDGLIPISYPNLIEAEVDNPNVRTELNVRDSDATLIFSHGPLTGGSEFTRKSAARLGRPWKHVNLTETKHSAAVADIVEWLSQIKPRVLNIAGPRASEEPRIYDATKTIMESVFMNQNLGILVSLRESVLSQCGGWDQIRWQVPSWFCTLGTISLGVVNFFAGTHYEPKKFGGFFAALGIFGILCFVLLSKLVIYERRVVDEFNGSLDRILVGDSLKDILKINRPFNFVWPRILCTATFWFLAYTAVLTLFFLGLVARIEWQGWRWVILVDGSAVVFAIVALSPRVRQKLKRLVDRLGDLIAQLRRSIAGGSSAGEGRPTRQE